MTTTLSRFACAFAMAFAVLFGIASAQQDERQLIGLWRAERTFGPEIKGALSIVETSDGFIADIGGRRVKVIVDGDDLRFRIPAGPDNESLGAFAGAFKKGRKVIEGHWKQPPLSGVGNPFASPVRLARAKAGTWIGEVHPYIDEFSLFLKVYERDDGSVGVFMRNPDRNEGVFMNFETLEMEGDEVSYIGKFFGRGESRVLKTGRYFAEDDRLTMNFQNRGGIYVFERVEDNSVSAFFARGDENPAPYQYSIPIARDDGWGTASLSDVGIEIEPIKRLIETQIQPPAENVHAPYIHGLLIARHGKLVFEDYFHGYHRDKPHDTRSASKSLTSVLIGAAMEAGVPVSPSTRVYDAMYGGDLPADLDPRKKRMKLQHLLTMSGGYFCDDRNPDAPGNEEVMQEQQDVPDWYEYTLNVPMAADPGEAGVYCSADANLAGGVLNRVSKNPLETLFDDLIAKPLQMGPYYLNLSPTGEPYMGGGIYWLPRDFLKLGQLMLDKGVWNGQRIISREWAQKATSPQIKIGDRRYGYFWWIEDYEYAGKPVRAFLAGGNGGNIVVVVPELDLVIAFFGGNYSDRVLYRNQNEFVPEYILPAVIAK